MLPESYYNASSASSTFAETESLSNESTTTCAASDYSYATSCATVHHNNLEGRNYEDEDQVFQCAVQTETELSDETDVIALQQDSDQVKTDEVISALLQIKPCHVELEFTQGALNTDSEDDCTSPPAPSDEVTIACSAASDTPTEPTNKELCVVCQVSLPYM